MNCQKLLMLLQVKQLAVFFNNVCVFMKWFVRPNGSFTLTPRLRFQLLECFCVEVFTLTYFALVMEMHWIGVGLCVSVIEDTIYILSYCHFRSSGPHTCPMSPRSCTEKAFIGKCWLFAI